MVKKVQEMSRSLVFVNEVGKNVSKTIHNYKIMKALKSCSSVNTNNSQAGKTNTMNYSLKYISGSPSGTMRTLL
jgi:hypothetical protein